MKKYVSLFIAVLCLLSCSKDDASEGGFSVVGKWVQTYYQNSTTNSYISQEDGTYFLFNADGSFTFFYSGWGAINSTTVGKYKQEGSMTVRLEFNEGKKAVIYITKITEDEEAVFSIDGGELLYSGNYKFQRR